MAINFPTSLDNFTNPSSGNTLDSPSHSLQHSDINDAVEAMQRKVGVGTAVAGSASAGQVLTISAAGTSTWSTPTSTQGLTLIATQSFSAVSSQSVNNVFTSTYDNYFIQIDFTHGSTQDALIKLRASGVDKTTNYTMTGTRLNGTTVGSFGTGTTTFLYTMQVTNNNIGFTNLYIARPAISGRTTMMADSVGEVDGHRYVISGIQTETATFDGFTFFCGTAVSGKIKVFGVNQ